MPIEPAVAAVIPARWASSRFPGKPLAGILGKPMIQCVVEQARKAETIREVIVATDDRRIFDAVKGFGGEAMMTSPDHASGTDRVAEASQSLDCEIVVNVQGDEPMIPPENIDLAAQALFKGVDFQVASLMTPISDPDDLFDPNITKVAVNRDGLALYFSRAPIPYDREQWPTFLNGPPEGILLDPQRRKWFKHIGLYAYKKSFLYEITRFPVSLLEQMEKLEQLRILENGFSIKMVETNKNSIGVDCPEDLTALENSLKKGRE